MADVRSIKHAEKAMAQFKANNRGILANMTCPWMWFVLSGFTLCAVGVIYWGFFCTMTDSVFGRGVMLHGDGMLRISAKGDGILENLNIRSSEKVSRDQIIGQIFDPETFFNLSHLEMEYKQLQQHISDVNEGTKKLADFKDRSLTEKEGLLTKLQAQIRQSRIRSEELSAGHKKLLTQDAISRMEYYRMLEQMQRVDTELSVLLQQHLDSKMQQEDVLWNSELLRLQLKKEEQLKAQQLALALKMYRDIAWLRAEDDGVIVELLKEAGDKVQAGETIALVNPKTSVAMKVVGFFPVAEGKKIRPGMSAYFAPSAFNPRDYGYVRGVVLETSPFAASIESITAELKNTNMAQTLAAQGVQMRVTVVLLPDRHTASRLLWTSQQGGPAPLDVGFMGTLRVTTDQRPPISYIIPYLRHKVFGIGSEESTKALKAEGA